MNSSCEASRPSRDHRQRRVTARPCLLCGGRDFRPVFEEFGIDIVRCRACRHVYSLYAGNAHYDGFWGEAVGEEGGESRYWDRARAGMYRDFLNRFVAGRSGRLLDMGCGLGYFVKAMAQYPAWETHGCEISDAAVRYARQTLGLSNVVRARLEDAAWPRESFDVITIWDVLDHLLDPDPVLRRCRELLTSDGVCFIRTPNVSLHLPRARLKKLVWGMRPDVPYLQARDHYHHYSTDSIRALLERNGFSRVEFTHLRPVDSISSGWSASRQVVRKVWFEAVRGLANATGGRLNLDNLFVVAHR
jgi:SAM-dependent methyltransferase